MEKKKEYRSALNIQVGIPKPPSVNPHVFSKTGRKRRMKYSVDEYVSGILAGNRTILSQAITLAESSLQKHFDTAQAIIEKCLPFSTKSLRIGITGVPGAGKSTFIETFWVVYNRYGKKAGCAYN